MRWEEGVGFLALALNVAGNLMLTSKRAGGWYVRLACNVAQLAYALLIWSPSLVANAAVFGGINVMGAVKWKRAEGHADRCNLKPCNCGRLA